MTVAGATTGDVTEKLAGEAGRPPLVLATVTATALIDWSYAAGLSTSRPKDWAGPPG